MSKKLELHVYYIIKNYFSHLPFNAINLISKSDRLKESWKSSVQACRIVVTISKYTQTTHKFSHTQSHLFISSSFFIWFPLEYKKKRMIFSLTVIVTSEGCHWYQDFYTHFSYVICHSCINRKIKTQKKVIFIRNHRELSSLS